MRRRTVVLTASAVTVVVASGWLIDRGSVADRHEPPRIEIPGSTVSAGIDPVTIVDQGGAGPRAVRSPAGARAVAVAHVLSGQRTLSLAPTEVDGVVRRYASVETADSQVVEVRQQLDLVRRSLAGGSGPIHYLQAPLAVRVEGSGPERARVSVWTVGVLWRRGAAAPQAGWLTTTVDLVWETGEWKVWAESTASGPTPFPNADPPVAVAELDRLLASFEPWFAGHP